MLNTHAYPPAVHSNGLKVLVDTLKPFCKTALSDWNLTEILCRGALNSRIAPNEDRMRPMKHLS